jgi:hypothetical protein
MRRPTAIAAAAAATLGLALAGCASADKTAASASASGANVAATVAGGAGAVAGSNSSSTGMTGMAGMSGGTTTVVNAKGVPVPVPVKNIGSGYWKSMKIDAEETTPVPFYVYDGASFREIKPKNASFHLMVMLNDRHTGVAIPYSTVWAYIYKNHKLVYNDRQWDMLSEYMGPHYGNDVTLPGKGTYTLKLLISAPVAALHVEYGKMWVGHHVLTSTFTWK